MALTNEQFVNNLSPNGLELAEEYLTKDLATLQQHDLPVSDTVAGLCMVKTRLEKEEEDTPCDG